MNLKTFFAFSLIFCFSNIAVANDNLEDLSEKLLAGKLGPSSVFWPADNAEGLIAWGESYRLKAYLSRYETTQDEKYLYQFQKLADHVLSKRDHLLKKIDALRNRVVNGWGSSRYTSGRWHNFAVHNAMVVEQLARFSRFTANLNGSLYSAGEKYLNDSKAIINEFNEDWKSTSDFSFYYFIRGAHHSHYWQPWNQGLGMGLAMLEILRAEEARCHKKTSLYEKRINIMAREFKDVLVLNRKTNAYSWEYSEVVGLEDFGHALIDLRFAYELYLENKVFTDEDMTRFANTYVHHLYRKDRKHNYYVNGSGKSTFDIFCTQLLYLNQFNPSVYPACESSLKNQLTARNLDKISNGLIYNYVLGVAELIKWRPQLRTALNFF